MTDVHTLSGAYALDALDPEEAAEFRAHLAGCAACSQEVRELREAAARMGAAEALPPPPRLRARVLAAADRTPQEPPPPRTEDDAQDHLAPAGTVERVGGARRRRRWDRLALAAAAVLVAGGAALGITRVLDDSASPAEQVFQADDARTAQEPTMNGGTLLVAVSPSQDQMAVDTSELPALAGNRVYQLWTIDTTETVESVGVFDEPGQTAAMAIPKEGVTVALTIEPAGGSKVPTRAPIVAVEPAAL
jgi:anti-sigma-K factor RskA